tara:strand:+ start:264 stop:563 length:300 start_codon:yes stop_codon:yes gene_type:complete
MEDLNNYYEKKEYLKKIRPLGYYSHYSRKLFNYSFLLSIFSAVFVIAGYITILQKNENQLTATTNVTGVTAEYVETERRKEIRKETMYYLRKKASENEQ